MSYLGPEHNWSTQTSAGDFLKAIITVSANASQNEQTCIGPNELTRQLVSQPCVEQLIKYMLGGGNPLTCGVGIIIEVIRKNNSDYDPDGAEPNSTPSSRDPIYLGTLLRLFAQHIPDFMDLIMNGPNQKESMISTSGQSIKPLGFDRFKTCELMAELLHCSNMGLLNEVGAEEVIAARDTHRRRLREEGRLFPLRVEDAPSSTEDLTMRTSHSSPAEEVRRLEVMNVSDDDGFEEVTHAPDEDSSHGVEELPEAPLPPLTSSFLDKDLDDFVEEPLTSPRLTVRELDNKEDAGLEIVYPPEKFPDSDEQELLPRPLSPTKKAVEDEVATTQAEESQAEALADKPSVDAVETKKALGETPKDDQAAQSEHQKEEQETVAQTGAQTGAPSLTVTTSETEEPSTVQVTVTPIDDKPPVLESMSPHPEDTPAPLFSGQEAAPTHVPAPTVPSTEDNSATSEEQQPVTVVETSTETSTLDPEVPDPTKDTCTGETPESEPTTPIDDSPINPNPVVGDYLKMQFVEHDVVPTILTFFFKYPWNNFLHNVVYDIVQQVFNGPMDRSFNPTLAISLFEAADVTNQIINGQLESEKSEKATKTRMGYMGHLTLIAEEVVKFTERHAPEVLGEVVLQKVMAQDWINYVEGPLAETRERDNAILGGVRPEVAMSRGMNAAGLGSAGMSGLGSIGLSAGGGSSALAEAGLGAQDLSENAGGSGIGPFAISSGTLMSGFGSSSDEDEDEEQENEEDVANEVSTRFALTRFSQPYYNRPSGRISPESQHWGDDLPEMEVEHVEDANEGSGSVGLGLSLRQPSIAPGQWFGSSSGSQTSAPGGPPPLDVDEHGEEEEEPTIRFVVSDNGSPRVTTSPETIHSDDQRKGKAKDDDPEEGGSPKTGDVQDVTKQGLPHYNHLTDQRDQPDPYPEDIHELGEFLRGINCMMGAVIFGVKKG